MIPGLLFRDLNQVIPKGPCTQYLGTWDLGNSNSDTGFG